jgi:F0F1-type ATP synthase delta subunit
MSRRTEEAGRYAAALLEATAKPAELWPALQALAEVVSHTPRLVQALVDASTNTDVRRRRLVAKLLPSLPRELTELVLLLTAEQALDLLPEITAQFLTLFRSRNRVVVVTVETPVRLSDAERRSLERRLSSGGSVLLTETLKPDLIGGLRLIINDVEHDYSLGGALDRLNAQLTA